MTRHLSVALAALALVTSVATVSADAQTPAPDETPIVQLGIFAARQANGTGGGGTFSTSDHDASLRTDVYIMPCSFGASSRMPTLAYTAWHIEGQVTRQTPQDTAVRVTWRRTRAAGQPVTGPSSTTDLTLTVGQHVVLDQETMPALGECPPMSVTLEARYEPRRGGMFTFTPNGRAARGGGFGGSLATASGGTASASPPASGISQVTVARSGAGAGTSVATPPETNGRVGNFLRHADLWLVHSAPGRDDEVLQTSTVAHTGGGDFAFPPVTIQTKTGTMNVRVTGTLELGVDADGQSRFVFGATRRVMFTPSMRAPRDRTVPVDSGGVANTVLAIPGPDEVLSFEMPPIDAPGVPAVPDHFAIRVRLSPLVISRVRAGSAWVNPQ